jgi:hypothetical protein
MWKPYMSGNPLLAPIAYPNFRRSGLQDRNTPLANALRYLHFGAFVRLLVEMGADFNLTFDRALKEQHIIRVIIRGNQNVPGIQSDVRAHSNPRQVFGPVLA